MDSFFFICLGLQFSSVLLSGRQAVGVGALESVADSWFVKVRALRACLLHAWYVFNVL